MVFSSHIFLFYFLPAFLIIYYMLPFRWKGLYPKNTFITLASYVFYGWLMPWFVLLMLISTTKDYWCGKVITKAGQIEWKRKAALWFAVLGDLLLLAFFKYYMFTMENINKIIELSGGGANHFHIVTILLPAGISFYTFVALSYTIDLYRGDAKPARNLPTFSCFIGLFPHLIAGPIIRYQSVADQLAEREHTVSKFTSGIMIFMLGFAKKILLADRAATIADAVFRSGDPGMVNAWWGILAYHFQIYFDFCGYSDMAVGLARMLGIEFMQNFNAPYFSTSFTTFWRRWHISLSSFIRDYLYIPMGGNRCSVARSYFNLVVAFTLSGIWHGAKWTFILWGFYHGLFLVIERALGKKTFYSRLPMYGQILATNFLLLFGWVMFRSPSIGQAWHYWCCMFGAVGASPASALLQPEIFSVRHVIEMLLCAVLVLQPVNAHNWVLKPALWKYAVCIVLFIIAIFAMMASSFSQFLYFQF
jgi:alginate O-acetyltransferase complex protein AlgI